MSRNLSHWPIVPLAISACFAAGATAEPLSQTSPPTNVRRAVAGRLRIGLRFERIWLDDDRRAGENGLDNGNRSINFLGSLWGLDALQSGLPRPFLDYRVFSSLGVGVAYEQARARTLDWSDETRTRTSGDGDVEIRGLQTYVFARYPNETRFTPQARAGYGYYWARFAVSPGWAAPGRRFEVDDTQGWIFAAGLELRVARQLQLELAYQHSHVAQVTARAYFDSTHHRKGAFPMRNDAVTLGAVWAF